MLINSITYNTYHSVNREQAIAYVVSRGIPASVVDKWKLGIGENYIGSLMLRDRLTIPIFGYTQLVAIAGRSLNGEMPKYYHNKFPKKKFVYGLHVTDYHDPALLVESFTDVWVLGLLGYTAYAVMSTMLSDWQIAHIACRHKTAIVYPHLDQVDTSNWCYLLNKWGVKCVEPWEPYVRGAEDKADSTWMYVNAREHLIDELATCEGMLADKKQDKLLDMLRG